MPASLDSMIEGPRQTLGNDWFLQMPGIAERFAQSQGFGDLFASGFNPGDGLFDGVQKSFSPELAARLAQYDVGRIDGADRMRQDYVIDRNTGQPVYADDPFKRQSTASSLAEGLGFVGSVVLGANALGGSGLFGGTGAAPAAAGGFAAPTNMALIESALGTPGYGLSSAGLGGGAGVLAGALPTLGTIPEASILRTADLPAISGGGGLFSGAGDLLRTPGIGRLAGSLIGGAVGRAAGGGGGGGGGRTVNMNPQQSTTRAPTQHAYEPSQAMPNGLGSSSAGLFDDWMKQQLGGGRRTYHAPTFGGGGVGVGGGYGSGLMGDAQYRGEPIMRRGGGG